MMRIRRRSGKGMYDEAMGQRRIRRRGDGIGGGGKTIKGRHTDGGGSNNDDYTRGVGGSSGII